MKNVLQKRKKASLKVYFVEIQTHLFIFVNVKRRTTMELVVKTFDELTKDELYSLLHLRAEIFVVEQNIVYQDLDYKDQDSLHVFYKDDDGVQAYLRIIPQTPESNEVLIGRIVTRRHRMGLGTKLFREGMKAAERHFGVTRIKVMSQVQAKGFYDKFGFIATSEPFMEEGLLHLYMVLDLDKV